MVGEVASWAVLMAAVLIREPFGGAGNGFLETFSGGSNRCKCLSVKCLPPLPTHTYTRHKKKRPPGPKFVKTLAFFQ